MADVQTYYVGDTQPPITSTLLQADGATPINLTGATVRFRMRALGSQVLKVDQPATIVTPSAGTVSYSWGGTDLNTAGDFLIWWQVTPSGGGTEDVSESLLAVLAHGESNPLYVEPEELKELIGAAGTTYMDGAVRRACEAATYAIEQGCNRKFWLDPADVTRTYTPDLMDKLMIDDLVSLTSLKIDRTGVGTFTEVWVQNTDFILEPQNAPVENPIRPWEWITRRYFKTRYFPVEIEQSVQVIGKFGWAAIPGDIEYAAAIIASKLLQRIRVAPFGVVAVGGPETGVAMRIARTDPDVAPIICEYAKTKKAPWG